MSENEKKDPVVNEKKDPVVNPEIEKIKADFKKEFEEFKTSLSKEMEKKDVQIKQLSEANDGLRAALVRQATTTPAETPKEKTKEEVYAETVESVANLVIAKMKKELLGSEKK